MDISFSPFVYLNWMAVLLAGTSLVLCCFARLEWIHVPGDGNEGREEKQKDISEGGR